MSLTDWAVAFGWNWALVPTGAWLGNRLWVATREPGLKYIQHSNLSVAQRFAPTKDHVDWFEKWRRHLEYPSIEPTPPSDVGSPIGSHNVSILECFRRERMFPWRMLRESWLVDRSSAIRESDGFVAPLPLRLRLLGMIAVAEARRIEVEELVK